MVIWLSPKSVFPIQSHDPISETDGLRIYDIFAAGKIHASKVTINPSVHGDFLSSFGSVDVALDSIVNLKTRSALVPRLVNRMVIIRERQPILFTAPAKHEVMQNPQQSVRHHDTGEQNFEKNHMLAFIAILAQVN